MSRNTQLYVWYAVSNQTSSSYTHLFPLRSPACSACQVELTVEHILPYCVYIIYNARDGFSSVFGIISESSIIDFIKETGFYRKI